MKRNPDRSPDLHILNIKMWVQNRENPDDKDYWDGNWLNVTIHVSNTNSDVWITGPILHLSDLKNWQEDIGALMNSIKQKIVLTTIEPNIKIEIEKNSYNTLAIRINLSSNPVQEIHSYYFECNNSDLDIFNNEIKDMLLKYPIRGNP